MCAELQLESPRARPSLPANIGRVFVKEFDSRPVLWIGNNYGAAIIKAESLD